MSNALTSPSMTELTELRLTNTPIREIPGPHLASFECKKLKHIFLADYELKAPIGVLRTALNPMVLEQLELENVHGRALHAVVNMIDSIAGAPLPFAKVNTLRLRN
jgi:hypothetical protein